MISALASQHSFTLTIMLECGEDISNINHVFPEYLGEREKGGDVNGPITYLLLISFSSKRETMSGSAKADSKFFAMK